MNEYDVILRYEELELEVQLHTPEDIDIVEARFIAAEMFSAIDSRFSILS